MECKIQHRLSIKRPKKLHGLDIEKPDYEFDEVSGYLYDEDGLFAICQLEEWKVRKWWIVHRPSEKPFASFSRKRDAERFLDFFFEVIDEDEMQYLTPLYSQIEKQLKAAYSLVHPKFWRESKG
mgnify:CR=1 FL=1